MNKIVMSKTMRMKIIIDVLMTAALLLLMSYGLLGEAYHEWVGTGMFLFFVAHHVLNRKWIENLRKGKYTPFRILQTVLVIAVLITMLGSMMSGILLSRYVFTFIDVRGVAMFARNVHMVCAYWSFVFMSLHFGLHWSMILGMVRKKFQTPSVVRTWATRIVGVGIAAYGIYAFIKRAIGTYMLLQVHFVFFDYEEPFLLFLLDYVAIMGLFISLGHYAGKGLKQLNKKNKMKVKEDREITGGFMMEYIVLNNGVKMPMAGIGTFLLTPDEAEASVIYALEDGYRLIDTANAYVNEKAVGRAMKKSGVAREDIFLETKLWPSFYEQEDAVEKTLERLDTDYIDLLLIHQPAGNYIAGYRQMEKAYKEGKVKAIGLSNFNKEQIQKILAVCEVRPMILQTEVHPYFQEKELKEFLAEEKIAIQAWYPLGHGDAALLQEPIFAKLGGKYGKSSAQIILRWHIQEGNVVIPGSKNPDHIRDNFALFDFALTDEEMEEISKLNKNVRYYTSTPDMLKAYAEMVPPVDEQK